MKASAAKNVSSLDRLEVFGHTYIHAAFGTGIVRPQFVEAGSVPGAGVHAHIGGQGQDNTGGMFNKAPPPVQRFGSSQCILASTL